MHCSSSHGLYTRCESLLVHPAPSCFLLQVDGDFGSIFGTLLPGTTAKLEPQEGRSFMEGARAGLWACRLHGLLACIFAQRAGLGRGLSMSGGLRHLSNTVQCSVLLGATAPVCRPGGEGGLWRGVEGEPERAERWPEVAAGAVPHPGHAAVQARAHLHPGRGAWLLLLNQRVPLLLLCDCQLAMLLFKPAPIYTLDEVRGRCAGLVKVQQARVP